MGAETEADQVGVVVDGDARVLADPADQGGHLQWSAYYIIRVLLRFEMIHLWELGGKFYPILSFNNFFKGKLL